MIHNRLNMPSPYSLMMKNTADNHSVSSSSSSTSTSSGSSQKSTKCSSPGKGRPAKPMSAFQIYFEEQRSKILLGALKQGKMTPQEVANVVNTNVRDCRHRRKQGKIGRREIKRQVQSSWKNMSEKKKQVYEEAAQDDLKRCQEQLKVWAAAQSSSTSHNDVPVAPVTAAAVPAIPQVGVSPESCVSPPPPIPEVVMQQQNNNNDSHMETSQIEFPAFPAFCGIVDSMTSSNMSSTNAVTTSSASSTAMSVNDTWMIPSPLHSRSTLSLEGDRSCSSEPTVPFMPLEVTSQLQLQYHDNNNNKTNSIMTSSSSLPTFVEQQVSQTTPVPYSMLLGSYDHVEQLQKLGKEGRPPNNNNNDDPSSAMLAGENSFLVSQLDEQDVDFICSTFCR